MDLLTVSAVDRLKDSRDLEVDRAKTERDERLVTYFFRGRGLDADDGIGSSRRGADIGESAQMFYGSFSAKFFMKRVNLQTLQCIYLNGHAVTPRAVATVADETGDPVSAVPNFPPGFSRPPWCSEDYREMHPAAGGELHTKTVHAMGIDFLVDTFQAGVGQCRKTQIEKHHLLLVADCDFSNRWVRRLEEMVEEEPELANLSVSVVSSSMWVALQRAEWRDAMLRQYRTLRIRQEMEEERRKRPGELLFRQQPEFYSTNAKVLAESRAQPFVALPFTGINDTGIPRDFVGDLLKSRLYVFSDPEFFSFCAWRFFECPPLDAHTLDLHPVHSEEEVRFVTTRAATLLPIDFKLGSFDDDRGERRMLAMFTLELTGAPARYYALFLEYDQKTAPPSGLCDRAKLLEVPAPSFAAFLPDRVTYSAPEGAFSPRRHWPVEIAGMVNRCEQFARDLDPESWNSTAGWVHWDEGHQGGAKTHFGHFRAVGDFPRETIDWVPVLTKPSVNRRGTMRTISRAASSLDPSATFNTTNRRDFPDQRLGRTPTPADEAERAYIRGHKDGVIPGYTGTTAKAMAGAGGAIGLGMHYAGSMGASVTSPTRAGYRAGSRTSHMRSTTALDRFESPLRRTGRSGATSGLADTTKGGRSLRFADE